MSWILEYFVVCCVPRIYTSYMFGWLCRATYCSFVSTLMLGVPHAIQNEKKLKKFTQSDSVYLVSTLMLGVSHAVEVLVLGLLVVV